MNKESFVIGTVIDPVLIVEDKKENQDLLFELCKKMNVVSEIASNGKIALDMCANRKFSVYIVDLMMPVMDGRTFISEIKKIDPSAIILVQTALDSSETIIDIMRMGVFDYVIKPIEPELFMSVLLKALEYGSLKQLEMSQTISAGDKIRGQIEWLNYKESRRMMTQDSTESKSIYSLKTSLSQGAGFGTLITLLDIMKNSSTAEGEFYKIDKSLADMVFDNNEFCRTQLDGLNFATDMLEKDFTLETKSTVDFVNAFPGMVQNVLNYYPEKKLKVTLPIAKDNLPIRYNADVMTIVMEELMVNAFKYSARGSTINVFCHVNHGYFWVNIKNDVTLKPYGGVPKEYEKLVLEPFYRIHPPDESISKIEKIGFGLGLAVVDYVAKKHGGIFIIHDVRDMTTEKERMCVLSEFLLPIWQ